MKKLTLILSLCLALAACDKKHDYICTSDATGQDTIIHMGPRDMLTYEVKNHCHCR